MTREDKQLLLKDLCARLPYGVVVNYKESEYDCRCWKIETLYAPAYSKNGTLIDIDHDGWIGYNEYQGLGMSSGSRPLHLGKVLPYLRTMSSMTDGEKETYNYLLNQISITQDMLKVPRRAYHLFHWLLASHFDYYGLIEKGLALEAPEGMYKIE